MSLKIKCLSVRPVSISRGRYNFMSIKIYEPDPRGITEKKRKQPERVNLPQAIIKKKEHNRIQLERIKTIDKDIEKLNQKIIELSQKYTTVNGKYQALKVQNRKDVETLIQCNKALASLDVTIDCPYLKGEIKNTYCTEALINNYCGRKGKGCQAREKALFI